MNRKTKTWSVLVAVAILVFLLMACTINDGGDWSDMDRTWMTQTVEAAPSW